MLYYNLKVLCILFIMCTFAAAKVSIALARRPSIR